MKPQCCGAPHRDRAWIGPTEQSSPDGGHETLAAFVALAVFGVPFHPISAAAFDRRGAEPAGASTQPARCSSAVGGSTRAAVPRRQEFGPGATLAGTPA
jgi:hypothetical protein